MAAFRIRIIHLALSLVFLLSAGCNMPGRAAPTVSQAGVIYTAAAQTVQAQLTQVSRPPATSGVLPTLEATLPPPTSAGTNLPPDPASPPPTATTAPAATGTVSAADCNRARFVADVTFPDDSRVAPGTNFVKTWRLENTGTCTWDGSYRAVLAGGNALSATAAVPVADTAVAPGETADISVTFQAPTEPGTYRSEWLLSDGSGGTFGTGNENKAFWVQIRVGETASGIVYDFIAQAGSATWTSGIGDQAGEALSFGGAEDSPAGAAAIRDGVTLETGVPSGRILLTVPRPEEDGYVAGVFPAYTVGRGDHLRARLGFLLPDGEDCGGGEVEFRILVQEGDEVDRLNSWRKRCNGSLQAVDLDLDDLQGRTVQFIFEARWPGSPGDDRAVWSSPHIRR